MIKSTISLVATVNGWGLEQSGILVVDSIATKREARALLRQARAAERLAAKFLRHEEDELMGRTACDIRCTSAEGPECSCSCLGANHSSDHLVAA
jgi:hypothetical protein